MIKYFFKKTNLKFLGLVVGMAVIGVPSETAYAGCCAKDSPGAACAGCCQKKWKDPSKAKSLQECQANCQKGNCRRAGTQKGVGNNIK